MTDLRTVAQQALEYMKSIGQMDMYPEDWAIVGRLEAALAQQAEPVEPVAQVHPNHLKPTDDGKPWCREALLYSGDHNGDLFKGENYRVKLYAAPPQRKPLTDEEIDAMWRKASECAGKSEGAVTTSQFVQMFARAVERKVRGEEK